MVIAASTAPVSSKLQSWSVMAARITASCHSKGTARWRTNSRHQVSVRLRNSRATESTGSVRLSSGPSSRVSGCSRTKEISSLISETGASVVKRSVRAGPT